MKSKIVLGLLTVSVVVILLFVTEIATREYLYKSDKTVVKAARWNSIIAEEINSSDISMSVDGILYNKNRAKFRVDNNRMLIVPVDIASEAFDCAINIYKQEKLVIEKGSTKAVANIGEKHIKINEQDIEMPYSIEYIDETLYIPVNVFNEYFGYSYNWDSKNYMAVMVNESEERSLPYYYSYVDENKAPKIRSQGNYGTCWAFASLTALESSLRPEENRVFSVDHMALKNSFVSGMNEGGDYTMSIAYLAAWQGPVSEKKDAYDGETDNYPEVKHVQEIQIIDSKNFEEIKEMVYKYGGVQSSLYTSLVNSYSTSAYYNKENASYCYKGENKPNHDVVIIGWDDNYSKENFNIDVEGDGAFICRNSWGKEFGDDGNFYVSYYDTNIGVQNIVYTGIEDVDNYDNIYQTDLCGWVGNMGYKDNNTAYFANVYTASREEMLEAVSFYVTDTDTEYEVYICTNYKEVDSLSNNRRRITSGVVSNKGYYTIKFNNSYRIPRGQKFAVIVKATTPNSTKPVAVEFVNDERTENVDISDGEGYISLKGNSWENVENEKQCNVCLKAFTTNLD